MQGCHWRGKGWVTRGEAATYIDDSWGFTLMQHFLEVTWQYPTAFSMFVSLCLLIYHFCAENVNRIYNYTHTSTGTYVFAC